MAEMLWLNGDGELLTNSSGNPIYSEGCICPICAQVGECFDGNDVEVEISGVVDGTCTDCENYNATHIMSPEVGDFRDSATGLFQCDCLLQRSNPLSYCSGTGSLFLSVCYNPCTSSGHITVATNGFNNTTWNVVTGELGKTYEDVRQLIVALCNGEQISLPPVQNTTRCDHSGSSCLVQII